MSRQVTIAGAGLAGLTAAINLARAGLEVEITEVRADAGARFHGDFQFFENWSREEDVIESLRRMNLDVDFPVSPVHSGTAWDDRRRRYPLHSDRPVMYMVRRGRFDDCLDAHLKKQALACGVRIRFNTSADIARTDIVATGPQPARSLIFVRGALFETDLENEIRVILDPAVAPGVYAYLVSYERKAVVCTAYVKKHHHMKRGRDFLAETVSAFQTTGRFDARNVSYFANFGISPLITRDSRIVVGEAAGFQDAVWGFGMRMAVQSGYLASRALIDREDYWDHVGTEIVPLVASTAVNRLAFDVFGRHATRLLLRGIHRSADKTKFLKTCYTAYGWKKLVFPLALRYCRGRQHATPPR